MAVAALLAAEADIVDTAVAAGDFKTLVTALNADGLADTLKGLGPLSVCCLTDDAFAKIPKADLDKLLSNKSKLESVVTYHVMSGKVTSAEIKPGKVKSVQGVQLTVGTTGGAIADNAKVVGADVAADNDVVHSIDTVLIFKRGWPGPTNQALGWTLAT